MQHSTEFIKLHYIILVMLHYVPFMALLCILLSNVTLNPLHNDNEHYIFHVTL